VGILHEGFEEFFSCIVSYVKNERGGVEPYYYFRFNFLLLAAGL